MTFEEWVKSAAGDGLFTNNLQQNASLAWHARDEEIAELRVVSDHNLHIYQEAASKLRVEIAESNARLDSLKDSILLDIEEIATLREQVKIPIGILMDALQNNPGWVDKAKEALAATGPI